MTKKNHPTPRKDPSTKGLQSMFRLGPTRPQPRRDRVSASKVPPVVPSVTTGRLISRNGTVLVDPERCPTLHRSLSAGLKRLKETPPEPPPVMMVKVDTPYPIPGAMLTAVPIESGSEVAQLIRQLEGKPAKAEAFKIRQQLRKLGHRGGLRSLRGKKV
jgi:hypothetical protein